ncbi:MAG: class I SAM-dependent methyltransferase [Verrucomicrobiota bacterium]
MFRKLEQSIRHARYQILRKTYTVGFPSLKSRKEIPYFLNSKKLLGLGVEIGVKEGKFSEYLLSTWKGRKLISIDPWMTADSNEYVDKANVSQVKHNDFYEEAQLRLKKFQERSQTLRKKSLEGVLEIEDGSLDFCYIDARHDYKSVLEDLDAWYPKVKEGGILAGHDYLDGMIEGTDFGVKKAVDEFFKMRKTPVKSTQEKDYPSWYAFKKS